MIRNGTSWLMLREKRHWRPNLWAALALTLLGCTGSVSEAPGIEAPTPTPPSGVPSDLQNGPGASQPGSMAVVVGPIGLMPVARLSRTEYVNTVRWLIGDAAFEPQVAFSPETGSASGFLVAPQNMSTKDLRDLREAAERAADVATRDPQKLTGCDPATMDDACLQTFIKKFGRRAWRRPLTDGESADHAALFKDARQKIGLDVTLSLGTVVAAILQSPHFLFKWEVGADRPVRVGDAVALTRYQLSSRLSFFLSDSAPDEALIADVDGGKFQTAEDLSRAIKRLLENGPALSRVFGKFHTAWLGLGKLSDLRKDTKKYKYWEPQIALDLESELQAFVDAVLVKGDGKFNTLLTAPYAFANARTSKIYGSNITGTALRRFDLDPAQRKGLLLGAPFLAVTGGEADSVAPRRGLQVWKQLFCGDIPNPPMDVPKLDPPKPNQTTRQRFEEQHDKLVCAKACHGILDPVGFAFENFGGAGDFRTFDNGQPVDSSGKVTTPMGTTLVFSNGVDFVSQLSASPEVHRCVATQWFRYATGRRELESEGVDLDLVAKKFGDADTKITTLLDAIVQSRGFRMRKPAEGEVL